MMFYLSKIAWGLFQPSSLILILLAAGAGFALLGNSKRANRLFLGGALLYAICGFSPLSIWLLAPLEIRASSTAAKVLDDAAGIIVLGGAMDSQSPLDAGTPHLNEAADRMTEAVRLANLYPSLPVIFSGGSAKMFATKNTETESELARRFFLGFNIVPPRLKLEDRSRNTRENAAMTAKLLKPEPGQKWILITSAFHMPRAKALFEAQGFQILAWPADYKTSGFEGWLHFFPRGSDALKRTDLAAKEWVGLTVAWLLGDISWH